MGQDTMELDGLRILYTAIQRAHGGDGAGKDPKELIERARERGFRFAMLFVEMEIPAAATWILLPERGGDLSDQILRRVKNCIRQCDCVCIPRTVAPISRESPSVSFAVLLENLRNDRDAGAIAERLESDLRRSFPFKNRGKSAAIRVGIALSSLTSAGAEDLLRHAAIAMQHARLEGNDTLEEARPSVIRNVPDSELPIAVQVVRSDTAV